MRDRYPNGFEEISIHSLRMEGDGYAVNGITSNHISIHSLRMEGDLVSAKENQIFRVFQSTPSAWRETVAEVYFCLWLWYFNPLPPHGGRQVE